MKNLQLNSISYILLSVLIAVTGNAEKAIAFDATPPKLESCKVNTNTLPASGGELVFTARISSVNGLERTPVVRMFNKNMTRWIADVVSVSLISGDSKSGEYQGKVTVKANLAPDRYYVTFDPLWDVSQNRTQMIWCSDAFVDYAGYTPPPPTKDATDSLDSIENAANAATDAALAAADLADAATAAAQDASDLARADVRDLVTINTQIENLNTGYKNSAATLATISAELDKRRAQIIQFQGTLNAAANSALKQRLASAISKLTNAVLVLNGSKSKLEFQIKAIENRRIYLLTARDQLISNPANPKTSITAKPVSKDKTILCLKGKSSLKVIGKNPKCPAGYKVKK